MRAQLSLSNVLLLVALAAVGVSLWLQRRSNDWYRARLPGLQDAARELVVEHPEDLYAVKSHPEWFDQERWQVYVPTNNLFRLAIATEDLKKFLTGKAAVDYVSPDKSIVLPQGRHQIELIFDRRKSGENLVTILLDDQPVIELVKPKSWFPPNTGRSSVGCLLRLESFGEADVATLHCSSISTATPAKNAGVGNGVFLWIDGRVEDTN